MESYDITKHNYLKNSILLYFIPGSIFILLFFLSDTEFSGCNIYYSLKLNILLKECSSITISSAIVGFILLFSIPYVFGHVFALLSGYIFRGLDYENCFNNFLLKYPKIEFKELVKNIEAPTNSLDFFGETNFSKFNYLYNYLIAIKSNHLNTLAQYNLMFNFFRNIALVFMIMVIIIATFSFFQYFNQTTKCDATCNSPCNNTICKIQKNTEGNHYQSTQSENYKETIKITPASLVDNKLEQSSKKITMDMSDSIIKPNEATFNYILFLVLFFFIFIFLDNILSGRQKI